MERFNNEMYLRINIGSNMRESLLLWSTTNHTVNSSPSRKLVMAWCCFLGSIRISLSKNACQHWVITRKYKWQSICSKCCKSWKSKRKSTATSNPTIYIGPMADSSLLMRSICEMKVPVLIWIPLCYKPLKITGNIGLPGFQTHIQMKLLTSL